MCSLYARTVRFSWSEVTAEREHQSVVFGGYFKSKEAKKDKKKAPEIHLIMCDPPLKLLVEQQSLTGFCIKYDADTELLI